MLLTIAVAGAAYVLFLLTTIHWGQADVVARVLSENLDVQQPPGAPLYIRTNRPALVEDWVRAHGLTNVTVVEGSSTTPSSGLPYPNAYLVVSATPVPFLIRCAYGWEREPLVGGGKTVYFSWFFGHTAELVLLREWAT